MTDPDDSEFRDLMHGSTSNLSPDVATLVAGGAARGRSRRRRHLVGTTALTVLSVGAVASGSALLASGGGEQARDGGFAGGGRSLVDASVATHDATHRVLAEDRFADVLAAMLPQDGGASYAGVGTLGSAGGGGQMLSTSLGFRGGEVSVTASDGALAGPVAVAEGETPPEPTPHAGPESACRAAEGDAVLAVTIGCREVENGDWALTAVGPIQVGMSGYAPDPLLCKKPCDVSFVDPGAPSGSSDGGSTVSLFTTDGWQIAASATAPADSDEPVLGDADLRLMAQDGDWFLAPGEEPPAPPTRGSADPDGSVGSIDSGGSDVPIASDRSPVEADRLPEIFADLLPGRVGQVDVEGSDPDRPAAKFGWDGYDVVVSVGPVTDPTCEGSDAEACESPQDGSAAGFGGGPADAPKDLAAEFYTADGWLVRLEVSELDPRATLSAEQLLDAAGSTEWFRE